MFVNERNNERIHKCRLSVLFKITMAGWPWIRYLYDLKQRIRFLKSSTEHINEAVDVRTRGYKKTLFLPSASILLNFIFTKFNQNGEYIVKQIRKNHRRCLSRLSFPDNLNWILRMLSHQPKKHTMIWSQCRRPGILARRTYIWQKTCY